MVWQDEQDEVSGGRQYRCGEFLVEKYDGATACPWRLVRGERIVGTYPSAALACYAAEDHAADANGGAA